MNNSGELIVLGPGESRGVLDHELKVGAAETGGAYALRMNSAMPPGRWVGAHIHDREEEAWYVLGGALTFEVDGATLELPAGGFILVPRGTTHAFGNRGDTPAAYLELFSPAGVEGFFEERLALLQAATGSGTDTAAIDPAVYGALMAKYHMRTPAPRLHGWRPATPVGDPLSRP